MPKSIDELPARKICASKHHKGSRWLLAIEFPEKWVKHKTVEGRYINFVYLQSYCRTCLRIENRIRKGITGDKLPKLHTDEAKIERRRERTNRGHKRRMKSAKYRRELAEAQRMRKKAKRDMEQSPFWNGEDES